MFEELDFKGGIVAYDDFDIDFSLSLDEQLLSLKEDLFQVRYSNGNNFTIDIGWYPEMDPLGNFIIYVIKNYDWENPLLQKKSKTIKQLTQNLKETIEFVDKHKNK